MLKILDLDVPEEERFDAFRETVARDMAPHDIVADDVSSFPASATMLSLGEGIGVSSLAFPAMRSIRTYRLIRHSDPEIWILALIVEGGMHREQGRNRVSPRPGELALYASFQPFWASVTTDELAQSVVLHLPRRSVPVPEQALRRLVATALPSATGFGALLRQLLSGLIEQGPALGDAHLPRLSSMVLELTTAFLGSLCEADGAQTCAARKTARLLQVKSFVRRRLNDPELTPATVAAAHHISLRTLHYLFREDGSTVGEFLREQRLEQCRGDLANPRLADWTIAAIGARAGFRDASAFSRAFRSRYGVPPGEYRRSLEVEPMTPLES
ncbi:helix-turn-helix domain-containing protein [Streptomyces seoulensis]